MRETRHSPNRFEEKESEEFDMTKTRDYNMNGTIILGVDAGYGNYKTDPLQYGKRGRVQGVGTSALPEDTVDVQVTEQICDKSSQ